ncbi:MAG: hypothetical protein AAF541_20405 [Pseudomonadota bacterium]
MRVISIVMLLAVQPSLADDRADYLLHCGGCHLPDGRGTPPEVPSLRDELGKIITIQGGRDYLVQVPGSSQAPVSDLVLANIINWILVKFNQQTLADDFVPLSENEVSNARKFTLADPLKRRDEIWANYVD